jgi:alpha-L-rhamnosidase
MIRLRLTLCSILLACICHAEVKVTQLRCEYLVNPIGIDAERPRLSWTLESRQRGESQTAYQVLVASSPQHLKRDKADLWDSGKVLSDQTAQVDYQGTGLPSRQSCFWKVRSWDASGRPGPWSSTAEWQMGLLRQTDWSARWIAPKLASTNLPGKLVIRRAVYEAVDASARADVTEHVAREVKDNTISLEVNNKNLGGDPALNHVKRLKVDYEVNGQQFSKVVDENQTLSIPEQLAGVRYLRKSFQIKSGVKQAVLYATALGLYEASINGERVGDHVLAPDWTDYGKRVRYQAYDVTGVLKRGDNALGAVLAHGWFSGRIGNGKRQFFGKEPAFKAQLEVTYSDGSVERVVSDSSWKSHLSPIVSSDFMLGESYDARLELQDWCAPRLDESAWNGVLERNGEKRVLEAQVMEPVRKIGELKPRTVTEPQPGKWVFDLGQNMVGVVRLKVKAPAGTEITLRHAEMLNPDGTPYTKNLRGAPSVDHYICKGKGVEIWQPTFTFHGFRYVELSGLPGAPRPDAVTGIVIASDTPMTGEFACSDPRINQLQSNILWGQRGNYLSVPTDCPQRDERLGWMGDAQVFIRTATYNADVAAFYTKWLVDVTDGQSPEGSYSDVCPDNMGCGSVPAWGDAGVICPWVIYETYGDKRLLERNLPYMIKWVEYLRAHSTDLIRDKDRGNDYGDWLSIGADTPKDLIGTAYFAYSTKLVAKACRALGREAEACKYEQLFSDIKQAFVDRYVEADGKVKGYTQTCYLLALKFDLLPEALHEKATNHLVDAIKAKNGHLSTGFVGVSYLLPVLTEVGKAETAYSLLLKDTFPSWLFSVKHGATTIWERWDGWTPEKGFQDPGMNSFNHYSLGSCGEYLFGYVGGIRAASPGFKNVSIAPVVCDGLVWARTRYDSIQGRIATHWKRDGNRFALEVTIPPNTTGTVVIPAGANSEITEDGKPLSKVQGVKTLQRTSANVVVQIGSGTYRFGSELDGASAGWLVGGL